MDIWVEKHLAENISSHLLGTFKEFKSQGFSTKKYHCWFLPKNLDFAENDDELLLYEFPLMLEKLLVEEIDRQNLERIPYLNVAKASPIKIDEPYHLDVTVADSITLSNGSGQLRPWQTVLRDESGLEVICIEGVFDGVEIDLIDISRLRSDADWTPSEPEEFIYITHTGVSEECLYLTGNARLNALLNAHNIVELNLVSFIEEESVGNFRGLMLTRQSKSFSLAPDDEVFVKTKGRLMKVAKNDIFYRFASQLQLGDEPLTRIEGYFSVSKSNTSYFPGKVLF